MSVSITQSDKGKLSDTLNLVKSGNNLAVAMTDQERRCVQHLINVLPQIKRVVGSDREGLEFPITIQQYAVLRALNERSYLISELADKFKVSRPTMTRIIDGLEGRKRANNSGEADSSEVESQLAHDKERRPKLVERVDSSEDRRLVYAKITVQGAEVLRCYHHKAEESITALLRTIPQEEIPTVERAFEILQNALQEATT